MEYSKYIKTINGISKSANDNKNYKHLVLPNGLNIMLINDLDTTISCATMCVGSGSLSNSDIGVDGLAHFLEHMLFLGSKKYPDPNAYSSKVAEYSGDTNAYTDMDHTCYYFSSSSDGFAEILDIWAQFFINPIFLKSSVKKEMNAVDSEHSKNLNNDIWREIQLVRNISNPSNKYNGFATGNLATLNRPDIVKKVREFYSKYYLANNMYLVLCSSHDLDTLEKISQIFNEVPNNNKQQKRELDVPILEPNYSNIILYESIRQRQSLKIVWEISGFIDLVVKYRNYNPMLLLTELLGTEQTGSIYDTLRKLHWATSLNVDCSQQVFDRALLVLDIELTHTGYSNLEHIIGIVYEYINIIKSESEKDPAKSDIAHTYTDMYTMGLENLLYEEKPDSVELSQKIASTMGKYGPHGLNMDEILIYGRRLDKYTKETNKILYKLSSLLIHPNSIIMIGSSNSKDLFNIKLELTDPWYGTKYQVVPYSKIFANEYKIDRKISKILHLPKPNKYIEHNLVLFKGPTDANPVKLPYKANPNYKLWYQFTNEFNVPYAFFVCEITLDELLNGAKNYLAMKLYLDMVEDYMNPFIYETLSAGFSSSLILTQRKLIINIYGPHLTISRVLSQIIKSILKCPIDHDVFARIKKNSSDKLKNSIYNPPYTNITRILVEHIEDPVYTLDELIKVSEEITCSDLDGIINKIMEKQEIRMLIAGNIELKPAVKLASLIDSVYNLDKRSIHELSTNTISNPITEPKSGQMIEIKHKNKNPKEPNSCLGMVFAIEYVRPTTLNNDWAKFRCLGNLLNGILSNWYMDELRTEEQLGYIVYTDLDLLGISEHPLLIFKFIVQSGVASSDKLMERTRKFINDSRTKLSKITKDDFKSRINSLVNMLKKPEESIMDVAVKSMNKAFNTDNQMEMERVQIAVYQSLGAHDLIEFYDHYIWSDKTRTGWVIRLDPPAKVKN